MNVLEEKNIDISKGMYMGNGIDLVKGGKNLEPVYIPWSDLNSHFMCFGTTRQGKTRLLAFMMRQIIEKGDHLIFVEPKGAEDQESLSWLVQYALQFNSMKDLVYWSPENPEISTCINLIYGQNDEEATSTIIGAMQVEEEFYEDIANEILMSVLPGLSFIDKTIDPLILDIMERMEYLKITIIEPINKFNKKMLDENYEPNMHEVKDSLLERYSEKYKDDKEKMKHFEKCYNQVLNYRKGEKSVPFRKFITFEDLAEFSTPDKFEVLRDKVKDALSLARKEKMPSEIIKEGEKAFAKLNELTNEDKGFYSKVSKSYKVTLTRLSTGNVGKLLCSSKINILRDRFYIKGSRVLMMAQPFPMKYDKAANMSIKMLTSMMNNLMSVVGVSGVKLNLRAHMVIDEAGAIATKSMATSLANKGGGLGISLYLYSQSTADYRDTIGEEGAIIMADNSNSKAFFKVNDDKSQETISALIGGAKRGDASFASMEGGSSRVQSKVAEEAMVPPSLIGRLDKMTYILKVDKSIYMMGAPYQRDPALVVDLPYFDRAEKAEKNKEFIENYRNGISEELIK